MERYEYSIFEICEALHMDHTGAMEGLTSDKKTEYIAALRKRLDEWRDPIGNTHRYDDAVRELIEAVLMEIDAIPAGEGLKAWREWFAKSSWAQMGLSTDEKLLRALGRLDDEDESVDAGKRGSDD